MKTPIRVQFFLHTCPGTCYSTYYYPLSKSRILKFATWHKTDSNSAHRDEFSDGTIVSGGQRGGGRSHSLSWVSGRLPCSKHESWDLHLIFCWNTDFVNFILKTLKFCHPLIRMHLHNLSWLFAKFFLNFNNEGAVFGKYFSTKRSHANLQFPSGYLAVLQFLTKLNATFPCFVVWSMINMYSKWCLQRSQHSNHWILWCCPRPCLWRPPSCIPQPSELYCFQ